MPFAKVIVFGNEDFEEFAKVFSVVFVQEFKIAKVKIAKFRDFSVSLNDIKANNEIKTRGFGRGFSILTFYLLTYLRQIVYYVVVL